MRKRSGLVLLALMGVVAGVYWRGPISTVAAKAIENVTAATTSKKAAPPAAGQPRQTLMTVATRVAEPGGIAIKQHTIGWVGSPASINLTSQQQGIVTKVLVADGSTVKAGDLLVALDRRSAEATVAKDRANMERDKANLAQAQRNLARAETLLGKGSGTVQTRDDAKAAVAVAQAAIDVDQAVLDGDLIALDNTEIRASFDGRVGAFQVAAGSLVQPGTAITNLTRMSPLEVQFSVAEGILPKLRQAFQAGGTVVATPAGGAPVTGKLSFIDNTVDRASGTVKAKATMPNDTLALWPGQSVDVELDLGSVDNLIIVPTVAVQQTSDGAVVFVIKPDKTVDVRQVTVAAADDERTGLTQGINPGEHVVVEGQIRLVQGMKVAESESGGPAAPPAKTAAAAPARGASE
jgi:multidrug efflux system membrane fusion protein